MNADLDNLRQRIGSLKAARVSDVQDGRGKVFRVSDARAVWNRAGSDAEKRALVQAISEHWPSSVLLLDPIDEDIAEDVLTIASGKHIDRAIALPSTEIAAMLSKLERGNWLLSFFESVQHLPTTYPGDVEATAPGILDHINAVGARAAIVAGPDSVDWLVAIEP